MKRFISIGLFSVLLSSCGNSEEISIISPVGAPTIAFSHLAGKENFTTSSTPSEVLATFANQQKDIIVFDSINGLKQITGANKAQYKLAKVITNGNYYITKIGHESVKDFNDNPYIVSFGENLVPDMVYKKLYPQLAESTKYVVSASDTAAIVCSGLHEGNKVDYVFGAMPSVYAMINKTDCNTYGKTEIYKNVQDDFYQATGLRGIPQAGVFVKNATYAKNAKGVKAVLADVSTTIAQLKTDEEVIIENYISKIDATEFQTVYGFNLATLRAMFKNDDNLLGLVDGGVDVNQFMTTMELPSFGADAFLDLA